MRLMKTRASSKLMCFVASTLSRSSHQVIGFGLHGFQNEIGLFDRVTGLAEVISAPLVAAFLCFITALGVLAVCSIADSRAVNDCHYARVCGQQVPINFVSFVGINCQRNLGILPRLTEF